MTESTEPAGGLCVLQIEELMKKESAWSYVSLSRTGHPRVKHTAS